MSAAGDPVACNVVLGDSLLGAPWAERGGFDIVLMNPPYLGTNRVGGARRAEHARYQARLRARFGFGGDPWQHFLVRGLELIRPGGTLWAVVTDALLASQARERLRGLLLEQTLELLAPLPPAAFPAEVATALLGVRNAPAADAHAIRYADLRAADLEQLGQPDALAERTLTVAQGEYRRAFGRVFFAPTAAHRRLFTELTPAAQRRRVAGVEFVPLGLLAPALDTGIDSGNVRARLFFAAPPPERAVARLIQGAQIVRYAAWWDAPHARYRWVDVDYLPDATRAGIGRDGRASGRGEYWRFRGPREHHLAPERLLLRQTEDEPFCAYLRRAGEPIYTDNTLHTLILTDAARAAGLGYLALAALLSSRALRGLYRLLVGEAGRPLAQVKTRVVNRLPIALPDAETRRELERLVEQVLVLYAADGLPLGADGQRRYAALQAEIDVRVDRLYAPLFA